MSVTLFSWGYWGWGSATSQLVKAVDTAERKRGFRPPIFVDIRLRRQGHARGFVGNAFRDVIRAPRYRWIGCLGNEYIGTGKTGIKIKCPEATAELLDLAIHAAKHRRRIVFYCACEFPWYKGKRRCHRDAVTELLLAEAEKRGRSISVVEWPGGRPVEARLKVDQELFRSVMSGRWNIPFGDNKLRAFAGLPWGSVLTLESAENGDQQLVAVGPPMFATSKSGRAGGHWQLPVFMQAEAGQQKASLARDVEQWRRQCGLHERRAG
jgi:hypothetical protein